nr:integrin beta-PS-like [Leptinotarsa decemlineata]
MLTMKVLYSLVLFIGLSNCQSSQDCGLQQTCEACIQKLECVWCSEPSSTNPVNCRPKDTSDDSCQIEVVSPKSNFEIEQSNPFSDSVNNPTQIQPQKVKLSLRKGEKYEMKFKYKIASNYPVDLYYIMDLSSSMIIYKKQLAALGVKLAMTMKNITTNFKLGFGSFIDKTDLPFVSTEPKQLEHPCPRGVDCVPAYSFKNHLPLSSDYEEFRRQVESAKVSGNLDSPEGSLDAIMQAIVCKEKIQWRDKARHLLILSTDAEFHVAGDGKLAGVVEPNNGKCHTDDKDFLVYDYPSVSHINYVAVKNNINLIFAIVKKPKLNIASSYKKLSENIKDSYFRELDDGDSHNVVNLVVDIYNKISQTVTFTSNVSSEVDLKFTSNCDSDISDTCKNVRVGQILEFTATIQVRQCPTNGNNKQFIAIRPAALNESLIVELDMLCECPCSLNATKKSDQCSNQGDLICGVCSCPAGRNGRICECDNSAGLSEDTSRCQMEGTNETCSGLGECKCGKCECFSNGNKGERIYGEFCQCNNYSCKKEGGKLCSDKGTCNCNVCECQSGYSGDACECEENESNCINPETKLKCSGHGKCVCGACVCNVDNNRYSGKYCDDCLSCPAQRCEELRYCVECQAYKKGKYNSTCSTQCTEFQTKVVDKLDSDDDPSIKRCKIPDDDRCIMNFEYYYDSREVLVVKAMKERVCPSPPNVLAWILGVIGSILLAGLIMLLIWKICTTLHDRREYEKFDRERRAVKFGVTKNPIFREATTTVTNPAYNRSSSRFSNTKQ